MKVQPYIDRLEKSKEYKDFIKEHKNAFLTAGFFVLDFEEKKNVHQLDFYIPKQHKVAAFTFGDGIKLQLMELMNEKVPGKLDVEVKTDLDSLHGILEDEMKNRTITGEIKKIVAVLQSIDGKALWNLNCVLSGMEILRAHVDDGTKSVLKMEKFSMMDLIKKVPGKSLAGGIQALKGKAGAGKPGEKVTKKEIKEQIEQIDKVEKDLEQKKEALQKIMEKTDALNKEKREFDKADKGKKKK